MKPVDVKSVTHVDLNVESNNRDPKFEVGNRVIILTYKNIFAKGYTPNWSVEVFMIKKVENAVRWTYVLGDFKGEELVGTFYEKELQKANQTEFRRQKSNKEKRW